MKFTTITTLAYSLLTFLSLAVFAAPLVPRDVFVPNITSPKAGDVWIVDKRYNVTWDTSNAPKQITNDKGAIYLRRNGYTFLNSPLAKGFEILLGSFEIIVPSFPDGDDYQIVLFGDSGNFSPNISIENI
jgi:hypothetical protein